MLEGTLPRPFFLPAAAMPMPQRRPGFTLVESLAAMTILAVAGGAVLIGLTASLDATSETIDAEIARGMAGQLMEEIAGKRYVGPGESATSTNFSATAWEDAGLDRERYDDIDDFHNYSAKPVADPWGVRLGSDDGEGGLRHPSLRAPSGYFTRWRQKVKVHYVSDTDPSQVVPQGQTSNHRAVEVTISFEDVNGVKHTLATRRRVFAYVPTPP
ncbi:MAG: type II secretion system protein [Pirellulales bacterium]